MFIKYPIWEFKHSAIILSSEIAKRPLINTIVFPIWFLLENIGLNAFQKLVVIVNSVNVYSMAK